VQCEVVTVCVTCYFGRLGFEEESWKLVEVARTSNIEMNPTMRRCGGSPPNNIHLRTRGYLVQVLLRCVLYY
jgi:hypothetical protein